MKQMKILLVAVFTSLAIVVMLNPAVHAQTPAQKKQALKEQRQKKAAELKRLEKAKLAAEKLQQEAAAKKAEAAKAAKEEADRKAAEIASARKLEAAKASRAADRKNQDAAALAALIDQAVNRKLREEGLPAAPKSTDEEFLRRVYLDITGVIPSIDEAKAFLDDPSSNKRNALIESLLANSSYGRKQADIWMAKLFSVNSDNRFVVKDVFYKWLEEQFNQNVSWDQFVYSIVTAEGAVDENPAVTYFLANRAVDKLTDTTTQHFMGVRLACAQCHNHPFTSTKQNEYWGIAAFYSKVNPARPRNANQGGDNTKITVTELPNETKARDFFPDSTKKVPPKFLGAEEPKLNSRAPYRPIFGQWLTGKDNPFFAKAMVNRTWAQLLGYGIVNPVDDLIETNEPSHPELLEELAKHFANTGFDVKYLIRAICMSETYQRTCKFTEENKLDDTYFSHMTMKVMTPEQLFDSLTQATSGGLNEAQAKNRKNAGGGRNAVGPRERFVQFFLAGAEEPNPVEYESGIPQVLRMMNSRIVNNPGLIRRFVTPRATPESVIENMYLATLSRRPTESETEMMKSHAKAAATVQEGYTDIFWALLNSSEFRVVR